MEQMGRKQRAERTRSNIIRCAVELFSRESYDAVTIQEICGEAGVSVGTFYHHFKNKEQVVAAAIQVLDEALEARWRSCRPQSCLEAVFRIVSLQAALLEERGAAAVSQLLGVQLAARTRYLLDKSRFFPAALHSEVERSAILGLLKGDAQMVTEQILRVYRGTVLDWCLHDGRYDLPARSERLVRELVDSL